MFTWQTRVKGVNKTIFFDDNNSVITEHDYAEALKAEFDTEIQSETFCFNHTIFIEINTC